MNISCTVVSLMGVMACLLLSACLPHKGRPWQRVALEDGRTIVYQPLLNTAGASAQYRADIHFSKADLTGILVIKSLGREGHRIALVSGVGITLLDLELLHDTMLVRQVPVDMDRKKVLALLERDFRMLLHRAEKPGKLYQSAKSDLLMWREQVSGSKVFYQFDGRDRKLKSVISPRWGPLKTFWRLEDYDNNGLPGTMELEHPFIGLNMTFRKLSPS